MSNMSPQVVPFFSSSDLAAMQQDLLLAPKAECNVVHRFGPGVYIREATYPKGTIVCGRNHAAAHLNCLLKGKINVVVGDGSIACLEAPFIFTAPPGKKVGYMLEDVVWQNIYATTETNIEEIEKIIFDDGEEDRAILGSSRVALKESKEDDRLDFQEVLKETGWTEEEVYKISQYKEDRIPFPYGTYKVVSADSPIQGKGFFATSTIEEGECVAPARLEGKRTPAGYQVNHSKFPNTKAVLSSTGDIYFVAVRRIQGMMGGDLGEEITLDYRQIMKLNNLYRQEETCQEQL